MRGPSHSRSLSAIHGFLAVFLLLVFFIPPVHSQSTKHPKGLEHPYGSYSNGRFGYSIDYPKDLLIPQGESDNGDGQRFTSKDGKAVLLVWGHLNVLGEDGGPQSPQQLFQEELKRGGVGGSTRVITYKVQKENWFVVSGTQGSKVFYTKSFVTHDAVFTFLLEYEVSDKATWDPIIGRIQKSFRAPK